jgi:hypothetical protein
MAKKDSKMQYIIGGSIKLGHIMCKTLCIYDSQMLQYIRGVGGSVGTGDFSTKEGV